MEEKLIDYFNQDELAANVWQSKYAMEGETTPDDMHRRMAREFARIEEKYKVVSGSKKFKDTNHLLSKYGQTIYKLDEDRVYNHFKDFKYIIPQGSIMYGLGRGIPVSLSNCFVIDSAKDSYGGIMLADQEQAQLMKRRGGVGHDLSLLRPKGTKVHNSAQSSTGMASFMHRFSNTTREVAQDGRRGALMLSIDINHPDVMDFIKIKRDGTSVTGANISIKLNDEFMKAVENDEDYILRFPCSIKLKPNEIKQICKEQDYNVLTKIEGFSNNNKVYYKKIKAKEYWDEIIKSARNYAEPGLMYWDNVINYDPAGVYDEFKPISSNPCGEQFLQAYDSCRLMAINLFSFVNNPFTDKAEIDYNKLYEVSYEQQRLADDLVDLEIEYIDRIIDKIKNDKEENHIKEVEINLWKKIQDTAKKGRRTGCGITALADMLAALNLKYDSDKGLEVTEKVMSIKMKAELDCTIDLAILRGTFEGWDKYKEFGNIVVGSPVSKLNGLPTKTSCQNDFYLFLRENFPEQVNKMCSFGRRNISWSTIAPTGSVSILTQTTSGCEPIFMPFYMRRKKINPNEEGTKVDFVDESGDSWQEFPVLHPKFKEWLIQWRGSTNVGNYTKEVLQKYFEQSPWYGSTANDINWGRRNEMQAVLQKYTTNAISSTINLPSTVTEQEVSDIYMNGWKLNLKGQTVYVDGSRSGVLVSGKADKKEVFKQTDAPKRPKELQGEIYKVTALGEQFNIIIGLLDGKPYEVFVNPGHELVLEKGSIIKKRRGLYIIEDGGVSETLSIDLSDEETALTRMISTSLRHGANIKFVVEQLNKSNGTIVSFSKAIARTLKKYIPDGEKSSMSCKDCGGTNVIFEEGCQSCKDCGSSKCG